MLQLQLCCRAELVGWGEGSRQHRGSTAAVWVWAESEHRAGVGKPGGRMSTAGYSWSDPLINCLLVLFIPVFLFLHDLFPYSSETASNFLKCKFRSAGTEFLLRRKSWSSAPDGFWEHFHCLLLPSKSRCHSAQLGHVVLIMLSNLTSMRTEPQCLLLFQGPLSLNFSR